MTTHFRCCDSVQSTVLPNQRSVGVSSACNGSLLADVVCEQLKVDSSSSRFTVEAVWAVR